jgi:hypothetical protein
MTRLLLATVRGYRLLLAPFVGGACRFHPSCSEYAEQVIARDGPWRGGLHPRTCGCADDRGRAAGRRLRPAVASLGAGSGDCTAPSRRSPSGRRDASPGGLARASSPVIPFGVHPVREPGVAVTECVTRLDAVGAAGPRE